MEEELLHFAYYFASFTAGVVGSTCAVGELSQRVGLSNEHHVLVVNKVLGKFQYLVLSARQSQDILVRPLVDAPATVQYQL